MTRNKIHSLIQVGAVCRTLVCSAVIGIMAIVGANAQTISENDNYKFGISGYLRTGVGKSGNGATQAHFQVPGALNKYSLGNQADTYGELEFDFTHYLNRDKSKSIDIAWMTSIYEAFGSEEEMSYNLTEQLYVKTNNLLGFGESIWLGNRFYDRRAIHMLDRQWINPGQKGWGGGIENLLNKSTDEDLKFAAWGFKNEDVISYKNNQSGSLHNYTVDARWVNKPITENSNINFALNYNYRAKNEKLDYGKAHGFGIFSWIDYTKANIINTTAVIVRQGANIPTNHWSGISQVENPEGTNLVNSDISRAWSLEVNNNFLYDDLDRFTINGILIFVVQDYGTSPYYYNNGIKEFTKGRGDKIWWASAGARGSYYVSNFLRLTTEYTHEYVDNQQLDAKGHLNKLTFTPEITLKKGFYSRPALRPFVNYAFWSDGLKGYIGTTPTGAPYANATQGFTYGVQFEIWW